MAGNTLGAMKKAAVRIGIGFDEYQHRIGAGEEWCGGCASWHPRAAFARDASRGDGLAATCRVNVGRRYLAAYVPKGPPERYGPPALPARDGDRRQARQRVNVLVRTGRLSRPNELPCTDCGHEWAPGERRHEYDHFLGYAAEHHLRVEAVCSTCHHRREEQRGATFYTRAS